MGLCRALTTFQSYRNLWRFLCNLCGLANEQLVIIILTVPGTCERSDLCTPPVVFIFLFFFSSSRCSFCRFCTSMIAEMNVFFTSFSYSSSSLTASWSISSSEKPRICRSTSSRRSNSSDTHSPRNPEIQTKQLLIKSLHHSQTGTSLSPFLQHHYFITC